MLWHLINVIRLCPGQQISRFLKSGATHFAPWAICVRGWILVDMFLFSRHVPSYPYLNEVIDTIFLAMNLCNLLWLYATLPCTPLYTLLTDKGNLRIIKYAVSGRP